MAYADDYAPAQTVDTKLFFSLFLRPGSEATLAIYCEISNIPKQTVKLQVGLNKKLGIHHPISSLQQ